MTLTSTISAMLITLIFSINLHAQNRPVSTDSPPPPPGVFDPEMIYDFVSEFPTYPGAIMPSLSL